MYSLIATAIALLSDLLARVTPARADKLDRLDAAVSSRAPANTAVSNAVLTDARIAKLDNLDNIESPPDRIKSRTHYQKTVSGTGAVIAFQGVGATDPAKVRVIFLGCWAPSGGTCSGGVYHGGASIVCQGNTASSGMTWSFIVEEYY